MKSLKASTSVTTSKNKNLCSEYKYQRNFTTNFIKRKKIKHVSKLIINQGKQTSALWNTVGNNQRTKGIDDIFTESTAQTLNSDEDIANHLSQHFMTNVKTLKSNTTHTTVHTASHPLPNVLRETAIIPPILPHDIILKIGKIDLCKSTGNDNI